MGGQVAGALVAKAAAHALAGSYGHARRAHPSNHACIPHDMHRQPGWAWAGRQHSTGMHKQQGNMKQPQPLLMSTLDSLALQHSTDACQREQKDATPTQALRRAFSSGSARFALQPVVYNSSSSCRLSRQNRGPWLMDMPPFHHPAQPARPDAWGLQGIIEAQHQGSRLQPKP